MKIRDDQPVMDAIVAFDNWDVAYARHPNYGFDTEATVDVNRWFTYGEPCIDSDTRPVDTDYHFDRLACVHVGVACGDEGGRRTLILLIDSHNRLVSASLWYEDTCTQYLNDEGNLVNLPM